ncbi:MAG: Hsp20/alpha crystallin family protein [Bacteroidetes bacterium]|nr:MAG: Hsp20/alpha crystallin family protein [Bacteroidota bacterium]
MALVKWNPGFLTNTDSFFEDFFKTSLPELARMNFAAQGTSLPAVNVKETEEGFHIELAAPGMNKDDFKLEVNNGLLTISAEKKVEHEEKKENYTRKEFDYQSFQRAFTLPDSADDSKIKATYKDGVLHVDLPKKEEAKPKPAKTIKVS